VHGGRCDLRDGTLLPASPAVGVWGRSCEQGVPVRGPVLEAGFGEAGPLEALLRDANFVDVRSKVLSRLIGFDDGAVFVRLNAMALVGMSAASKDMGDEDRERIVTAIERDSADVVQARTPIRLDLPSSSAPM
jgi:hypothetical protein